MPLKRKPRRVTRPIPASRTPPPRIRKAPERERPYTAGPAAATPSSVFLPDHEQLVRYVAARGATDRDFEIMYGLSTGTVKKWRKHYPGLDKAIADGRTRADGDVLFAMYKNAVGFKYTEQQAVGGREPEVLTVERFKPGETAAQKHWLGNRLRTDWPSVDRHEVSGPNGSAIGVKVESRNEMIDTILKLIIPKSDPERTQKPREEKR